MKLLSILAAIIVASNVQAGVPKNGFTPEQMAEMAEANQSIREQLPMWGFDSLISGTGEDVTNVVPFAEYDKAGYLLISSAFVFDSKEAKKRMAQNLPKNMILVVYTEGKNASKLERIQKQFAEWIPEERLKVISLPGASRGFWARDGVPVPVWQKSDKGEKVFTVVDAKYYHGFEADEQIADIFSSEILSHPYFYEGGNFMANSLGECVVVNTKATRQVPDLVFSSQYGCQKLIRLPFAKGIGHIDESFKFITDKVVVTDEPKYVKRLEEEGYQVVAMPRPSKKYETYVNTLLVNGVAFVPVFGQKTDKSALKVFQDLGYKAVPMPSVSLSNNGLGSIHCITMVYPPVPFDEMMKALGGTL